MEADPLKSIGLSAVEAGIALGHLDRGREDRREPAVALGRPFSDVANHPLFLQEKYGRGPLGIGENGRAPG